ncbi:MAG: class I SAM-dependent methyltransferase [Dehalococcoidia bacterium]|nr:class I SAM-dependent methyltransferase [Dehalococcoidia bacterium]
MLWDERETARAYDRWLSGNGPISRHMRWLMGPLGLFVANTPVLALVETLALQPEHRLLDLGCGEGTLARYLQRSVGFTQPPVAMDISRTMLRLARALADPAAPVALVATSASALPFADESFDFVIAAHVWKHLDDRTFLHDLLEVRRVLRTGGSCVAWEFAPRSSTLLNRWNRWVLERGGVRGAHLRAFHVIASAAMDAGFSYVERIDPGPFLWPPIPRVAVRLVL